MFQNLRRDFGTFYKTKTKLKLNKKNLHYFLFL